MKNIIPVFLLLFSISVSSQPLQEYYFNNSLAGTGGGGTITELLSCSAVAGSFGTDSIITTNGLCSVSTAFCFNAGGGFSYPNSSITGSYSINLFFKFNTLGGWSRIIDFSNSVNDAGFYLLNNCLNFFPNGNVGTCPYFQPNIYYLFTFVRDGATNIISVYVNGTLFSTYNDTGNVYRPATNTTPIIFFRDDNAVPCESKAGCIKYASVSSQLLSAAQVDTIWQNICNISLPPCTAAISYLGTPFNNSITSPQSVTQTGTTGGIYTSTSGLTINSTTGAITPSASTPGTYTVTYSVSNAGVCSPVTATTSVTITSSSFSCSPSGNTIIFSNYDGGFLNINVDVNIPNLKIGVVTYEPVVITLTGPYAANVTKVLRAGFPNTNNNNCNLGVFTTAINGPVPANYSIVNIPPVGLSNPNGYASGIICAYSCNTTSNQGGCNTIDQVLDYFNTQLGGSVYSLNVQYCCWQNTNTYQVSALSNSCCNSPSPSATIAYPGTPYCKSLSNAQPVTLTGSPAGTFSASPSGLSIDAVTGSITPGTSNIGNYTVTYSVAGCPNFTTTAAVGIIASPAAGISYAANAFCSGAPVQNVTQTGTTGGIYSAGTGLSIDSLTGTIAPANSAVGNYTISYTLPASGGCAAYTTTAPVAISQAVTSSFTHSICQGDTYSFSSYVADTTGIYTDTLSTSSGCDSILILNLTVNTLPTGTITTNTTIFCPGDSTQICAPAGLNSYLWNTGANGSCIYAINAGNYYVTVTDANSCSAESNHTAISVYPLPSVSVSVNGDTLSAYNATSYQWYLNGIEINGAQNSIYIAPVTGSYQVQVTDTNGCTALSNSIQVTATGITEIVSEDFKVYPNPVELERWNLECGSNMIGHTLEIFDASGRMVFSEEIRNCKSEINFTAAKGIYYLRVNTANKQVVKKLIHL